MRKKRRSGAFVAPDHKTTADYQEISEQRAVVVQAELTARFANLGIEYDKVEITTEGMSDRCPVGSNGSKSGRAQNRRVEIWIHAAAPPPPPPPKTKTKSEFLKTLKSGSSNPTTQCLAGKLLSSSTNADYLTPAGITAFMSKPIQKVGTTGYTSFELDMSDQLEKTRKRIADVPTKQSDQSRFDQAFKKHQADLIDGVRALQFLDCYDKRTPALKRHFLNESKRSKSLYSCPEVKKIIDSVANKTCTG